VLTLRFIGSPCLVLLLGAAVAGCGGDPEPGAGGGGAGPAGPECAVDGDCKIVVGCCTCGAAPVGEPPAACEATADCDQSHCSALGIPEDTVAACVGERCVMGFECDLALVTCDGAEPACEDGETPRVVDGCHAGCVPAEECRAVSP
jgi:hypothetical protein